MKKFILIYGILMFLIFEKLTTILVSIVNIVNITTDFNIIVVYFFLSLAIIIPFVLFLVTFKKIDFNLKNLIFLIVCYIISLVITLVLTKQLGGVMADHFSINKGNDFIEFQGQTHFIETISKMILLVYLSIRSFGKINSFNNISD